MSSSIAVLGTKRCSYCDYSNFIHAKKAFVLSPGLGDLKEEYRLLGPKLAAEFPDYRVLAVDLRGMGKSDVDFPSYTPEDTGHDLLVVIESLNLEEVVLVGCSMSAASILIPAAESSKRYRINALIFLSPFAWEHSMPFGIPTLLNVLLNTWTGSSFWTDYYRSLYTIKPTTVKDLDTYCQTLKQNIREPGRLEALRGHLFASKAFCAAQIPQIAKEIPILTIYGTKDPDFPDLTKEMKDLRSYFPQHLIENIVTITDAGHYPHVEAVEEVIRAINTFMAKRF